MKEEWKEIDGYGGIYQVSNLGRVKSIDRYVMRADGKKVFQKGKILAANDNSTGYKRVALGKSRVFVHRLVAKAFLENPNDFPTVNHKDFNPHNNCVWNLEWCSYGDNNHYSRENGRCDRTEVWRKRLSQSLRKRMGKPVVAILKNGETIIYPSAADASEDGYSAKAISNCCRGRAKTHKGLIWNYKENKNA